MSGILLLFSSVTLIYLCFMVVQAVAGKLVGGRIEEAGLFLGPRLVGFDIGGLKVRINCVPLGSYVKFTEDFERLSPSRRLAASVAGLGGYVLLAAAAIGFAEGARHLLSGFGQIAAGAFSPRAVGSVLIGSTVRTLSDLSFVTGTGILAAKMMAYNLLPLGSFPGFTIISTTLELLGLNSGGGRVENSVKLAGFFITIALLAAWIAAGVFYIVDSR